MIFIFAALIKLRHTHKSFVIYFLLKFYGTGFGEPLDWRFQFFTVERMSIRLIYLDELSMIVDYEIKL